MIKVGDRVSFPLGSYRTKGAVKELSIEFAMIVSDISHAPYYARIKDCRKLVKRKKK